MRTTGRATNPAWFTSPLELDNQLHIRVDGERVDSWIFDRLANRWYAGPPLISSILEDPGQCGIFAADFLGSYTGADKGLGVVLHLADEFSTAELSEESSSLTLSSLRESLQEQPAAILDDKSLAPLDHGWGVFPYVNAAGKSPATAIVVSRNFEPILTAFRQEGESRKIPVQTCALSAPLLTLQALPFLVTANLACAFVAVLHYPRFTTLAFFDKQGNLLLLRSLPHRTQRRPHHLYFAINTTATALEFVEPQIVYLSYLGSPDLPLLEELTRSFGPHRVSVVDWPQTQFHPSATTPEFAEPQFAVTPLSSATTPLATSETFTSLQEEKWALQDFIPTPREEAELYPTETEVKLIKTARTARWAMLGLAGAVAAWASIAIVTAMNHPAWKFSPAASNAAKQQHAALTKENAQITHWDNLLEDRSKSWASMELITQLFPDGSGVQLDSLSFSIKPSTTKAPSTPASKAKKGEPAPQQKSGFIREWKIIGIANDRAMRELLPALADRESLLRFFQQTAEVTGDQSYSTEPKTRSVTSQMRTSEAKRKDSTGSYSFDLTIEQTFTSTDPLGVITSAAP